MGVSLQLADKAHCAADDTAGHMRDPSTDNCTSPMLEPFATLRAFARLWRSIASACVPLVVLASLTSTRCLAQSAVELRGTVEDSLRRGVGAADVIVTDTRSRRFAKATTDSTGNFVLRLEETQRGVLLVFVSHPAFGVLRRAIDPGESIAALRLVLPARRDALLATVSIVAARTPPPETPDRDSPFAGIGGGEEHVSAIRGAVPPSQQGDLQALAVLGGTVVAAGGSSYYLGAGGAQNTFTSDGLGIGSGVVPRSSRARVKVISSAYDISMGGFAGVAINATPQAAERGYQSSQAFLTQQGPALRLSSESPGTAPVAGATTVGAGISDSYFDDALGMNASVEVRRAATQHQQTLSDAARSGVCAVCLDSAVLVARDRGISFGQPKTTVGSSALNALLRLDRFRRNASPITTIFALEHNDADVAGALFSASSTARRQARTSGSVQAQWTSPTRGSAWLTDLRAGARWLRQQDIPALARPLVSFGVLNNDDSLSQVAALQAGGGGDAGRSRTSQTAEVLADMQRRFARGASTLKLIMWSRLDRAADRPQGDEQTSVSYASLHDFVVNQPSSYSARQLFDAGSVVTINGAIGIADQILLPRRIKLLAGVRLEGGSLLDGVPPMRTSLLPSPTRQGYVMVSPRLGLDIPTRRAPPGWVLLGGPLTDPFIAREPLGILRLGFGRFAGRLEPTGFAASALATSQDAVRLVCVGDAVPALSWTDGALTPSPTVCRTGSGPRADSGALRLVVGPRTPPPSSWRSTASYSHLIGTLRLHYDLRWALNVNQPSLVANRNFAGMPNFSLAQEGARPVYVSPLNIDERSGLVSPASSRVDPALGDALLVGGLRSGGAAATVRLSPQNVLFQNRLMVSLSYTIGDSWAQSNGYTGSTAGDPRALEQTPSPGDARHIVVVQVGVATKRILFSGSFVGQSGLPFTPMVASDVNGDGQTNDRAFIPRFDASGGSLGLALARRLPEFPGAIARCLTRWQGTLVGAGTCRGPWTVLSQLRVETRAPIALGVLGIRSKIAVQIENPVGAIAVALHNRGLERSTASPTLDATLLIPRTFSIADRSFTYIVNPNFARAISGPSLVSPPRITLDAAFDFTTPADLQLVRQSLRRARRGEIRVSRSAERIREAYAGRMLQIFSALADALVEVKYPTDSLETLGKLEDAFRVELDSLWRPASERVAALSATESVQGVLNDIRATDTAMWNTHWLLTAVKLRVLLGPERVSSLPDGLRAMLNYTPGAGRIYFSR